MVTYHPVTLEHEQTRSQMTELLSALSESGLPVVFTHPNADTGNSIIIDMLQTYVADHPNSQSVVNLGADGYFSLMAQAAAMVGNSSSGIIEAASFRLPVVNVGIRQQGRIRAENVIDAECRRETILEGIRQATSREFGKSLVDLINPYGDGHAAGRIVERLKAVSLDGAMLVKRFQDVPYPMAAGVA